MKPLNEKTFELIWKEVLPFKSFQQEIKQNSMQHERVND
jgi:hypothetical protein